MDADRGATCAEPGESGRAEALMPGGCWLRRLRPLRWWFFFASFARATAAGSYLSSLRCEAEGWEAYQRGRRLLVADFVFQGVGGDSFVFENFSTYVCICLAKQIGRYPNSRGQKTNNIEDRTHDRRAGKSSLALDCSKQQEKRLECSSDQFNSIVGRYFSPWINYSLCLADGETAPLSRFVTGQRRPWPLLQRACAWQQGVCRKSVCHGAYRRQI